MEIPCISSRLIHDSDIDALMQIGFCYFKFPHPDIFEKIQTCLSVARKLFQSTTDKIKYQMKDPETQDGRYQGYALRSNTENANSVEQFFFEPEAPYGPYTNHSGIIQEINQIYRNEIFLPLLNAIFKRLRLSYESFLDVTVKPYSSLVFLSYPKVSEKNTIRLNAHKDFGLITILYVDEPGLEVKYGNSWYAIPPKEGHLVINIGNALELMTGKRCHSALHRVSNAKDNRMSMVYFINANYQQQVRNYQDGSIIAATGEIFFKEQFKEYYQVEH